MFSKKCFCKGNISEIVRPLLAALSVNGLISKISEAEMLNVSESVFWRQAVCIVQDTVKFELLEFIFS